MDDHQVLGQELKRIRKLQKFIPKRSCCRNLFSTNAVVD